MSLENPGDLSKLDLNTLDSLLSVLNTSGTQNSNNALYQTVAGLIKRTKEIQSALAEALTQLKTEVDGGKLPNKAGGLLGASYLTKNDDHITLPNARKTVAGSGISIDYGTAHEAIISGVAGGTPVFFPDDGAFDSILIPGPAGTTGAIGPTGPTGPAGGSASGGGVPPFGLVDEYGDDDFRQPGAQGIPGPVGSLNYFAAQPSANTNGTADTAVAVTGASIILPAGTYLIWAQISIRIAGSDTYCYCEIYDGAAIVVSSQNDLKIGISTVGYTGTAPVVVTLAATTTMSLRFATGLAGTNSIAMATFGAKPTSGIFAVRLDGSPAYGNLLKWISYNPGTTQDKTTSSATFADVDATNLLITFVAPSSGSVIVSLTGDGYQSAGNYSSWNLRDGSGDIAGTAQVVDATSSIESRRTARIIVTGLTPGTSYTYKWGFAVSAGTAHLRYGAGSPLIGPAVMEVWDANTSNSTFGRLLGFTGYAAGSDTILHTQSSNTMTAVDTTNATVTFIAPNSGKVIVRASALSDNNATGDHYWGLIESGSTIATAFAFGFNGQPAYAMRDTVTFYISGLTPGSSHTYQFAHRVTAGTVHIYSGPNYGQVIIEVWDAAISN